MKSILDFCIKDISLTSCGEVLIWIGTAVLLIAGVLELIKKPKE